MRSKKRSLRSTPRASFESLEHRLLLTTEFDPPAPLPLDPGNAEFLQDGPAGPLGTFGALARLPDGSIVGTAANALDTVELEPSMVRFATDGTRSNFAGGFGPANSVRDIAVSPDKSQIVFTGFVDGPNGKGIAIQRLLADGVTPVATYAIGVTNLGLPAGQIAKGDSVVVQSNGTAIVAAEDNLVAFRGDKSIDTSFGQSGIVTLPFSLEHTSTELAIQSDGKLLVVGTDTTGPFSRLAVARYTQTGSLDATFGTGGVLLLGSNARGRAVAVAPDGSIYVGGSARTPLPVDTSPTPVSFDDLPIAKLTPTGTLDPAFPNTALNPASIINGQFFVFSVNTILVASDGDVFAAGGDGQSASVVHISSNASSAIGTSYGAAPSTITDLAFTADNHLFAVGNSGTPAADSIASTLAGFTLILDTNLDPATPTIQIQTTIPMSRVLATLPAPGGEITTVGTIRTNNYADFALWRYTNDGATEPAFGNNGLVLTDFGQSADVAEAATLTSDGKILVAGSDGSDLLLARYTSSGDLDTAFATAGKLKLPIAASVVINGITTDAHGGILISGTTSDAADASAPHTAILLCFTPSGALDTTFAAAGRFSIENASGLSVAALSSGLIAFTLRTDDGSPQLQLLDSSGTAKSAAFPVAVAANRLFVRTAGQLLLVGSDSAGALAEQFTIDSSGNAQPDSSFGVSGVAHFSNVLLQQSAPTFADAYLQSDGKLDVALNVDPTAYVVRLTATGSPDATFGHAGLVQVGDTNSSARGGNGPPLNFPGEPFAVSAVTQLSNNKIITGGIWMSDPTYSSRAFLAAIDGGIPQVNNTPQRIFDGAAAIEPPANPVRSAKNLNITVRYVTANPIRRSSLGNGELTVTGQNNYTAAAKLDLVTTSGNLTTAVYEIPSPHGGWKASDAGDYVFTLQPGNVLDINGVSVPATSLTRTFLFTTNGARALLAAVVTSPVAPIWYPGVKQTVTLKIINIGTANAHGNVSLTLNLTTDGLSTDPDMIPVAGHTTLHLNLPPGQSKNVSFTFTPDRIVKPGAYGVTPVLSAALPQLPGHFTTGALNEPTLVPLNVSFQTSLLTSPTVAKFSHATKLKLRVTNTGATPAAGQLAIRLYASAAPTTKLGDPTLLNTTQTINLAPGASTILTLLFTPRANRITPGNKFLTGQITFLLDQTIAPFAATTPTKFRA